MRQAQSASLLAALLSATQVAAHGHVTNLVVDGVYYEGFDISVFPYESDPPKVAAWTTPNTGNGFISPDAYRDPNIICHENATNAQAHVVVGAGEKINIQWTAWPDSHHGPVLDYLARCDGSCETVDKTDLEFFKIDGVGLISDSEVPGTWGTDQLINNNNSWMVEIPPSIAAGNYVLRHELIALHGAEEEDGAQNYPQCFNLQVTGTGTATPSGVKGTELYTATENGILVNIYSTLTTYTVPGPTAYSGAVSITQTTSAITSTGTAVVGSASAVASASSTAAAATSAAAVTSVDTNTQVAQSSSAPAAAAPSSSSSAYTQIPVQVPSSWTTLLTFTNTPQAVQPTTSVQPEPAQSTITPAPAVSSAASGSSGSQSMYGQCGGINWTGATQCASGSSCHSYNPYYYQCIASA
ncbi:hypothetical protein ABZX51_008776 [Aspergillus tubingensis]|uniref:AA9 family lytic polysaccharide monooxygenase n=2 Tax=Aspergillus subgen. Circumdati TaxID=2720871 RepID=A0A318Z3K9_ASPNB|nr:family 61 glycosyl hydrolase [Aspergillus neoniger CBS 115656]XP_025539890.1 family 61 glycosyl hydrolase [Aspergillus costaricaensis CBS 115574]PYH34758.1 family 61 glycosyl hydrolase [Aspergillus neoniger CBS 115656]RAK89055.1 family 61 glycosyl hydrolase [Aspergillus costaricaensis CBS 115574]